MRFILALTLSLLSGCRTYTLQKFHDKCGNSATKSAHPGGTRREDATSVGVFLTNSAARFSPDDRYSRQRVTLKQRFGLLPKTRVDLK